MSNLSPRAVLPSKSAAELLATPVQFLKGVGPDRAKLLERIGLHTAADVLFNFPRNYQDLTDLRSIDRLEDDKLQSVRGTVEEVDIRNTGMGRSIVGLLVSQEQCYLRAIWFNMPFMADKFRRGQEVLLSGKPRLKGGRWEMAIRKCNGSTPMMATTPVANSCPSIRSPTG
jgi:ATP-dependent DNA helicase RecG